MLFPCGKCLAVIDIDRAAFITCSGTCDKRFHTSCVDVPADLHEKIISCPGLFWKCTDCCRRCFSIDQVGLMDLLQQKYSEMLKNLDKVFEDLKSNFIRTAVDKNNDPQVTVPSYSDILSNNTQPAILIKPKSEQTAVKTKIDVKENISTVDMQLSLSKVKSVKDGGVVVGFSSREENLRFKKAAKEKLSDNYEIRELKGVQPRVKIVGLNQIYKENEIVEYVEHAVRNNSTDINLASECTFIKLWPTKKNPKIYQVLVQLDRKSYDFLMNAGGLFIGYDHCSVFDAVQILRCFNCNGYHHSSKSCKSLKSCPRCAMNDHAVRDCTAEHLKCVNCLTAIEKENLDVDPNHAAWDVLCPVFIKAVEKFKKDILFKQ